ncbi:MAG: flagellar hook-associated protein FlgL [Eubacteriales bacterium]|nr:flagellar hook-associated protein FlgL [Eubacteriales bacterium]
MRITNGMITDKFITNMQNGLKNMDYYSDQLSSGHKLTRISDDPVAVMNSITARRRIVRYEMFQDNLDTASSWVYQTDTCLQELSGKVTTIYENLINAASDINNLDDQENFASLMRQYRDSLMETLNTSVGGQHLFAGYNTTNAPFTKDAAGKVLYNGLDLTNITDTANEQAIETEKAQAMTLEVGYALQMDISLNGIEVVGEGDNNLFKVMDDIITCLESGEENIAEDLGGHIKDLQNCHTKITTCLVESGAMQTKITTLKNRYAEDIINYNEVRSNIEDIDYAEAVMNFKMKESVYQATLAVGANIIQPTLLDFLR